MLKEITANPYLVRTEAYSVKALRLERAYKIFAWGVLTLFLFCSFLASFVESFTEVLSSVN